MNVFYQPGLRQGIHTLDEAEAHHAIKVLRLEVGDQIQVTDGLGAFAEARVSHIDKRQCQFEIDKLVETPKRTNPIHLFVAPTKQSDRIEWLVEKVTEIGIDAITLMQCERSERKHLSEDRLLKVALSALKQSQQSWLPVIEPMTPFSKIAGRTFDQKFIAYVDSANPDHLKKLATPTGSRALLIGPEGDFTPDELTLALQKGWTKVSLGDTRLRTETAALVGTLLLRSA